MRERGIVERAEPAQHMEREQARYGSIRLLSQFDERGRGGFFLALMQQPRGGIAMPAIRVRECRCQFYRRHFSELWRRARC